MRKRLLALCLVLLVLTAVLVQACGGDGGEQEPPPECNIVVNATVDTVPWTGLMQYTLTGPGAASPITGTSVEDSFAVDCGWTCAYVSGGPAGASFVNITPSATQCVSEGGTTTFTLNFAATTQCSIEVKATLDGSSWSGDVSYTLTGPGAASPITGTSVSDTFTAECGNWTCAYVSGGPAGASFVNVTPSATQSVSEGDTITFTLNFVLEQDETDARIEFDTWCIHPDWYVGPNKPASRYDVNPEYHDCIGIRYRLYVDGCQGKEVTVNVTSRLEACYTEGYQFQWSWLGVVNDDQAVSGVGGGAGVKVSQVPSFNSTPVEQGEEFWQYDIKPGWCLPLNVETTWDLVKGTWYTQQILWLGVPREGLDLFHLELAMTPENKQFKMVSSVEVELIDDVDVDPGNNKVECPPLYVVIF